MVDRRNGYPRPSVGFPIDGKPVTTEKLWFALASLEKLALETLVDAERIKTGSAAHFPASSESAARLRNRRVVKLGEVRGVHKAAELLRAQLDSSYKPRTISRARIERDFRRLSSTDGQRLKERSTQMAPEVAEEIYYAREMEVYHAEVPAEVRNARREDLSE